jgi:hypothetical protein
MIFQMQITCSMNHPARLGGILTKGLLVQSTLKFDDVSMIKTWKSEKS